MSRQQKTAGSLFVLVGIALALGWLAVRAGDEYFPAPAYPTTRAVAKKVTVIDKTVAPPVTNEHPYRIMEYTPEVELPEVPQPGRYDTPEAALQTQIASMRAGDYAWFMDTWEPGSRKRLEAADAARGEGAEFWRAAWAEHYGGRTFHLKWRLELDRFALFITEVRSPTTGQPRFNLPWMFTKVDGRWLSTNEAESHPVFHHLAGPDEPDPVVERTE